MLPHGSAKGLITANIVRRGIVASWDWSFCSLEASAGIKSFDSNSYQGRQSCMHFCLLPSPLSSSCIAPGWLPAYLPSRFAFDWGRPLSSGPIAAHGHHPAWQPCLWIDTPHASQRNIQGAKDDGSKIHWGGRTPRLPGCHRALQHIGNDHKRGAG